MTEQTRNWAGNITFTPERLHRPTSIEQLQDVVASSDQVRVLGSGHSFNEIADTPGDLVMVADLPQEVTVADDRRSVRVSAGLRYGEVTRNLQAEGLALHNLGSLPHISVAGAVATGTHGSGIGNGSLPTAVNAVELVTADGSLRTVRRGEPGFSGSVVALGALGVVTHLHLDVQPTYDVAQHVYTGLPHDELVHSVESVLAGAYSVSVFTRWQGDYTVWLKRRLDTDGHAPGETWHGGRAADRPVHPIPELPGDEATEQLGVPGPWNARLPHFRLEFTPSLGDELQSEYFVARDVAAEAIEAVAALTRQLAPVLMISEIRTIAGDGLWLSPAYARETLALHFTWRNDIERVRPVTTALEKALDRYDPRPHWGKVFTTPPERVRALYPRLRDAARLFAEQDPKGTFRNAFVERYLGTDG